MNILNAEHIEKTFEDKELLKSVTLGIGDADKIGVVGVNGCGKSTLLAIVAGELTPDAGEVIRNRNLRISYLAQNPVFDEEKTLLENVVRQIQGKEEHWDVAGEAKAMLLRFGLEDPEVNPSMYLTSDLGVSYMDPTLVSLHIGCWRKTDRYGADTALTLDMPAPERTQFLSFISSCLFLPSHSSFTTMVTFPVLCRPSASLAISLYRSAKSDIVGFTTFGLSGGGRSPEGAHISSIEGIAFTPSAIVASCTPRVFPATSASTDILTTWFFMTPALL